MKLNCEDVLTIVNAACEQLPEHVQESLEDVEVIVAAHHRDEVLPHAEAGDTPFPEDFKGCYIGTTIEADAEDAEENPAIVEAKQPVGTIYLNAANLADQEEVHKALYHEIGHALGLSEEDVTNLGLDT